MIVKVLGSAAGGAFPQWNCSCENCFGLRRSEIQALPRTQSQIAISRNGRDWHLLNASPDLRVQIERTPELHPQSRHPSRQTPIGSVTLTNADLDHVLGLLLMRESQPLSIYATKSVQEVLLETNMVFRMLRQFDGQTIWHDLEPGNEVQLQDARAVSSGLYVEPVTLIGKPPLYARTSRAESAHDPLSPPVVGLIIREEGSAVKLGYFPGVASLTDELLNRLDSCDLIFFDGTFWSDDEMTRAHGLSRTARDMGHVPLSGPDGVLQGLSGLRANIRRCFIHINNTNPILNEASRERALLYQYGWTVSYDGMELAL